MSYLIISKLLNDYVDTITGIPNLIKDNEIFTGCKDDNYVRSSIDFDITETFSLGETGSDLFPGELNFQLFYNIGSGSDAIHYQADNIISYFKKGMVLKDIPTGICVRIDNYSLVNVNSDPLKYIATVVIDFESYIARTP